MYITYGKVFGGTPKMFMFWLFPENGRNSEQTVNRALIDYNPMKFCINKKYIFNFHFHHVPKLFIGFKIPAHLETHTLSSSQEYTCTLLV